MQHSASGLKSSSMRVAFKHGSYYFKDKNIFLLLMQDTKLTTQNTNDPHPGVMTILNYRFDTSLLSGFGVSYQV